MGAKLRKDNVEWTKFEYNATVKIKTVSLFYIHLKVPQILFHQ